jgi:hypothetical protein
MPADDHRLHALRAKLDALVRAVLDQARENPAFADRLHELFMTADLPAGGRKKSGGRAASGKETYNPISVLGRLGREGLRRELEGMGATELADVLRVQGVVKGKAVRGLERDAMIEMIVQFAERKLNQGIITAGSRGESEDGPPDGAVVPPARTAEASPPADPKAAGPR